MKKKIVIVSMNKFLSILLALLVCGCTVSTETEKYQSKRNNIINVRDKIVAIEMEDPMLSSLCRLHLIDDYLIIQDMKSFDELIYLFDKNDYKYVTGLAYRGQGPGEIANMGFLAVDEARRTFYVNDHGKQSVFSYPLDSVLSNPSYMPGVRIKMDETLFPSYYHIVDDSMAICRIIQPIGNNDFNPTTGKMNMNTGEITLMEYDNPKSRFNGKKRMGLAVSLAHGLYAEYYERRDLMTLCSLEGDLICNIYGPLWSEDSKRNSNLYFYQKALFCGDNIYALYLGGNSFNEKGQSNLATKLLVFDLQGNYIHTLETGLNISDLCYDPANNRLLLSLNDDVQFGYLPLD